MNKIKDQNKWEILYYKLLDIGSAYSLVVEYFAQMLKTPVTIISIIKLKVNKKITRQYH